MTTGRYLGGENRPMAMCDPLAYCELCLCCIAICIHYCPTSLRCPHIHVTVYVWRTCGCAENPYRKKVQCDSILDPQTFRQEKRITHLARACWPSRYLQGLLEGSLISLSGHC